MVVELRAICRLDGHGGPFRGDLDGKLVWGGGPGGAANCCGLVSCLDDGMEGVQGQLPCGDFGFVPTAPTCQGTNHGGRRRGGGHGGALDDTDW